MTFDYRYTIKFSTTFAAAASDPVYTLSGWAPNPYGQMALVAIRPNCSYITAAGKTYTPSLKIGLSAPGLVVNYRDDYTLSAPSPATSTKDSGQIGLDFNVDSKLMGQVFECFGIMTPTPWSNVIVTMLGQFGSGGGTTVANGGTSYGIGDIFSVEIDFFFKVEDN